MFHLWLPATCLFIIIAHYAVNQYSDYYRSPPPFNNGNRIFSMLVPQNTPVSCQGDQKRRPILRGSSQITSDLYLPHRRRHLRPTPSTNPGRHPPHSHVLSEPLSSFTPPCISPKEMHTFPCPHGSRITHSSPPPPFRPAGP